MALYGGIEAGGTKFICAIGTGPDDLRATVQFPTTTPQETIGQAIAFFREQPEAPAAIGVGSFGPVDLHSTSPTFGSVTTTPKSGWQYVNLAGVLGDALAVPIAFDTDVNVAALGEHRWGAARDVDTFIYLTIGTGIGGGALVGGRLLHGLVHPEMGHMRLPHDWTADPFPGICPYHGDCWEGMSSGPALQARWGQAGATLPPDHAAWPLQAHYIALALMNLICVMSPQCIILGGGVMQQSQLFPLVWAEVQALLNGYVQTPAILDQIDSYIVPPALGGRAGVLGAIALAEQER